MGHVTSEKNTDIAKLSYEQARDELVSVVTALEQGGISLEESIALWERGEALAARCDEWLIGAKARLEAAKKNREA
ncbi:MAG: exodeoxyribonuclease VII small subunit [Pontimonas sp.]|nr:exodeoxyribonuclease VII small subunit [Pontimonas sp.]